MTRDPYYSATTLTKDEYYAWQDHLDAEKRYKESQYKRKQARKMSGLERRFREKQHEKLLCQICEYALRHGWSLLKLPELLEPGEELPERFQPTY